MTLNTLMLRQNGCHFADDILTFLNENVWIPIKISLKFVPKCTINNIPALVQIMAWHRPGAKPLSEPMIVRLLTHICVTQPQRVNSLAPGICDTQVVIFKVYSLNNAITNVVCNIASILHRPQYAKHNHVEKGASPVKYIACLCQSIEINNNKNVLQWGSKTKVSIDSRYNRILLLSLKIQSCYEIFYWR